MREITSIRLKWSKILLLNMLLKLDQRKNIKLEMCFNLLVKLFIFLIIDIQIYSIKIILRF